MVVGASQGRVVPVSFSAAPCNTSNMTDSRKLEMNASAEALGEAAALLSAVSDPVRLGLLTQLAQQATACVCDMQTNPPIPDNLLSYHLKVLRDAGLVQSKRRGRWMDYSLVDGALERLHNALPSPNEGTEREEK